MSVASVYEMFLGVASRRREHPFMRVPANAAAQYASGPVEYTYEAARVRVEALRGAYSERLPRDFSRVAVAYDSRLDVYLNLLALNGIGAGIVPLNMAGTDEEIAYVLAHSDCGLVVAAKEYCDRLETLVPTERVVPVVCGQELASDAAAGEHVASRQTEAALLYTSGTTGKPKGCMLSNEYFLRLGQWYVDLGGYCELTSGDRLVTPLPPNHMNALATSFMGVLTAGATLVQLDRFHPSTWWQTLRDEKATVIHYLGVMPAILLTVPPTDGESFAGQIKFGFGAGSDPRHQAVFEERFGFPLIEAWAMTETGAAAVIIAHEEPRHLGQRCIGRPVDTMEIRLVDEAGNDVPTGESGELLVRSRGSDPRDGFFSGYYKNEAATDDAWSGGWFHTGDVVRADSDGSYYFVDRRKNVIRRSGENIAAVEVEAALFALPAVGNAAVTAVPDEIRGDEVFAYIVAADGAGSDEAAARAIVEACLERLTYFKVPGYLAFVDELPLTASQKVKRGDVKTLARASVENGDCFDLRSMKRAPAVKRAPMSRHGYDGVVVAAPVSIAYERYSTESAHWWLGRAIAGIAEASGIGREDFDGLCASSFSLFPDTAVALSQHFGLTLRWLDHVPTGGASGVMTLRRAARAVQSGDASVVACIAGDTNHVDSFRATLTSFSRFSQDAAYPYGSGGPNASFSLITSEHMRRYGTTREDFGKLCVAQRDNALRYPDALMKKPLTLEQYLDARPIADPIALFDCVMPCAGAEGFVVLREADARAAGLDYVHLRSTIERHNAFPDDPIQYRGGWLLDVDEFWALGGVAPDSVDLVQTYDDYPVISAMQIENLGFCENGGVAEFIRANTFTVDGTFPHNTSGGQLSVGQAGAAGGFLGLVEAVRQLSGSAGGTQVANAKIAVCAGFGIINFDRGLCSGAALLEAAA